MGTARNPSPGERVALSGMAMPQSERESATVGRDSNPDFGVQVGRDRNPDAALRPSSML